MKSYQQGSQENPIVMKMLPGDPPGIKAFIQITIFTVAPVALAIIMQKPALRQAIIMRLTHDAKDFCQQMADFWQDMALKFSTAYHRARM